MGRTILHLLRFNRQFASGVVLLVAMVNAAVSRINLGPGLSRPG